MIFPSNWVRIVVASKPVDFRKGHDGLAALVKNLLHRDPVTGTVFVFRSKRADRLKLIYWDGTGLVMAYKCLEDWPAIRDGVMKLSHAQFEALFAGRSFMNYDLDFFERNEGGVEPAPNPFTPKKALTM